jgi:eukaryotic-like serine/threonine-protein kinase
MELVRGVKITDYCDQARLTTRERLELFVKVCQAIQHAHQKGIIHRDIKPSNILVTLHDGVPVPKVIDFGIAKATQGKLTDQTLFTAFEQFIGTPAYMSPEQAEMSGLDIDTRSDIYSLGVLLYELLTGSTPFDTRELMRAGVDEMRRIIREVEPMRPSTRLTQHSVATKSQITNRKSPVNSDLDWIVMKCLEKDRRRRYETANGLAADLRRHLSHELVVARPPSAAYKIQKAWRRNKVVYSAAGFVATALVVGMAVSLWQAGAALRARQQAEDARRAEAQERRASQAAQAVAEQERANAQQVADDLLETLYAADIRAAYQAIQVNDFALAADLIGKYRPYIPIGDSAPFVGQTEPMARPRDLLGWEWRWLWQLCRSDELDTLQSAPNAAHRAVLAPHGRFIVTASDRWLRVLDHNSMEVVATLGGPEEFDSFIDLGAVAFSGDGRYLAAKGGTSVRVWRVGQWQSSHKQLEGLANFSMSSAVVFSPDSRTLATRVQGGIGFWDTETWGMTLLPAPERLGTMMKYSRDGALLAMDFLNRTNNSGDLQIRDANTLGLITNLVRRPAPAQSEDIANSATAANVTGAASGGERRRVPRDAMYNRAVAADFSDRFLAVGYRDGELKLFDLATWAEVVSVPAHPSFLFGLAFSPDGRVLATGGKDQVIKIWDVTSPCCSHELRVDPQTGQRTPRPSWQHPCPGLRSRRDETAFGQLRRIRQVLGSLRNGSSQRSAR